MKILIIKNIRKSGALIALPLFFSTTMTIYAQSFSPNQSWSVESLCASREDAAVGIDATQELKRRGATCSQSIPAKNDTPVIVKNFGLRFIELGRNVRDVWKDYDVDARKQGYAGAQAFGENCNLTPGNYGNHKVAECTFTSIRLLNEKHDLLFATDNDLIVLIEYPSMTGKKLESTTSEEFIANLIEDISKKYSMQPVITSKPIKLKDDFSDENEEFMINCRKVMYQIYPNTNPNILHDACDVRNSLNENGVRSYNIDWDQLPRLAAMRKNLLSYIKSAESKKGASCINCNGTLITAQWGETGTDNVIRLFYTKRDLTKTHRFYNLRYSNDLALAKLKNARESMIKNIESNVLSK